MQTDPIGMKVGRNLCGYASGRPATIIDPTGLYGSNNWDYYHQRCLESGGQYYCDQAPYWCEFFPSPGDPDPSRNDDYEGWPRCVRQCLQDCDREVFRDQNSCPAEADSSPGPWEFWRVEVPSTVCHWFCYLACEDDTAPWINFSPRGFGAGGPGK